MVRLREIPRTAAFAWSHSASPFVATGTRSGAVDADFSDETKLELWDLNLDSVEQGLELQPIASVSTESRYGITRRTRVSNRPGLTQYIGSMTLHGAPRARSIPEGLSQVRWRTEHSSSGTPRS